MSTCVFVHIGDTHLNPGARNADRLRALDQIINENITRTDLAAWLWPGDLFHQRSSIDDRNALAERMQLMGGRAPIVVVYGNHDSPGDLDVFAKLATSWPIYVVARPQVLTVRLATGNLGTIFCLPYPTEAGLVSAGVAPGAIVQTAHDALEAIFIDAAAQLEAARERGEITLMIGHVNVAGSIVSTGQPNIGHEIEVDDYLLGRLGECYIGLNHIHKAQVAGNLAAHYPGSVCRLDWGEIDPKGYLEITYGPHEWGGYAGDGPWSCAGPSWVYDVRQRPLNVAPMYHVEGWLSRDGFSYSVTNGGPIEARIGGSARERAPLDSAVGDAVEKPSSWRGCEVRVRARFHQSEKSIVSFARAHVLAEFAEAERFELELVCVPDRALRAPAVADAKTLSEKVAAWAQASGTVLPESVLAIVPALEHADADAVVAKVQQEMDVLVTRPADVKEQEEAVA